MSLLYIIDGGIRKSGVTRILLHTCRSILFFILILRIWSPCAPRLTTSHQVFPCSILICKSVFRIGLNSFRIQSLNYKCLLLQTYTIPDAIVTVPVSSLPHVIVQNCAYAEKSKSCLFFNVDRFS